MSDPGIYDFSQYSDGVIPSMVLRHDQGNWEEAFKYIDGRSDYPRDVFGDRARAAIRYEDVVSVYCAQEGEGDGRPWLLLGRAGDNRYFFLRAGCDYTGWG